MSGKQCSTSFNIISVDRSCLKHSGDPGQSFGTHLQGDHDLPRFPAQPVHLRPYRQARILAQPVRNHALENGAHLPNRLLKNPVL
jgi:hypothetical protein